MTHISRRISRIVPVVVATIFAPIAAQAKTFAQIVNDDIVPLGDKVIQLLYALSFIVFLIGMVRLFFSDNEESRQQGKYFAIYGIIALAILFTVWGFVRALKGIIETF